MGAFWWGCPVSQRSILFWLPQTASLKLCERHASKTSMSDPGPAAVRTHGAAIPAGTDGLVRHFSKPSPSFSLAPGSGLCAAASLLRHRRAGCALRRSTVGGGLGGVEPGGAEPGARRSGCCLESCSCPSRCPVCAPFATSFSLSVGSRSCCLPAGVFFGWHNGSAVCSTARVASAAGQATATSPANSERSSESSPKPIAQADPGSGPPSRRAAIVCAPPPPSPPPPPRPPPPSMRAASEPAHRLRHRCLRAHRLRSCSLGAGHSLQRRAGRLSVWSLWSEPPAAPSVPPSAPPPSRARRLRPSQYLQRRSPRCVRSLRVLSCVSGTFSAYISIFSMTG